MIVRTRTGKIHWKEISPGESIEAFMASLKDSDIYSHPETHRLMVRCAHGDIWYPEQ